jgi:hypothetical protein
VKCSRPDGRRTRLSASHGNLTAPARGIFTRISTSSARRIGQLELLARAKSARLDRHVLSLLPLDENHNITSDGYLRKDGHGNRQGEIFGS